MSSLISTMPLTEQGMRLPCKVDISANLFRTIEQLYDKATRAIQMKSSTGEWFITTIIVRQGCFYHSSSSTFFLEQIMSDALEEHELWKSMMER